MPIPLRNQDENKDSFMSRCMQNNNMKKEYPDYEQRMAVCFKQLYKNTGSLLDKVKQILQFNMDYSCSNCDEESEILNLDNVVLLNENEYLDYNEQTEEFDLRNLVIGKYQYKDPLTHEMFYFEKKGNYKKNNRYLRYEGEAKGAEYQGRKVILNKPFRTPDGPKKFAVYTKNEKGTVVIVRFGDPDMKIKKNIPERRKSFRARHNCDNPGPKWKARYWSCKAW